MINCVQLVINCAQLVVNCAQLLVNCVQLLVNCAQLVINCTPGSINCAQLVVNCAPGSINCVQLTSPRAPESFFGEPKKGAKKSLLLVKIQCVISKHLKQDIKQHPVIRYSFFSGSRGKSKRK
jgi:hypothetical protein